MKVGILGGTFDPIHSGHIRIAKEAKKELWLDKMWIMPARIPPHKNIDSVTDNVHRLMMIELSIPDESIEMKVMEFGRAGKSYTSETLQLLHDEHPDGELYYLMGEDSLRDFPKWHEPETIASLARIPVAIREEDSESFSSLLEERNRQYGNAFVPLSVSYQPVSSTMLREMLRNGEDTDLIAPRALKYIHRFGLYGTKATAISPKTFKLYEELKEKLAEKLSEHRLTHCIGVAHLAADFMQEYEDRSANLPSVDGYYDSVQQAFIAGILHDCAKYVKDDEFVPLCEENGIEITEDERKVPELLHAKLGSLYARTVYGIEDPMILSAIAKHCTGEVDMNPVETAVYTADFCEPFREHIPIRHSLHSIRLTGYRNLSKAAHMATECTIAFVESMGWTIDRKSYEVLNGFEKAAQEYADKEERKSTMEQYTSKDLARTAFQALENKKGFDIKVIEIDKVSTIADYFVIADGSNPSQVEAMVDEVQMKLHQIYDVEPKRIEGARNCGWILMDYGDIVVHVFSSQDRLFYDLERVWRDGMTVDTTDWKE